MTTARRPQGRPLRGGANQRYRDLVGGQEQGAVTASLSTAVELSVASSTNTLVHGTNAWSTCKPPPPPATADALGSSMDEFGVQERARRAPPGGAEKILFLFSILQSIVRKVET